MWFQFDDDDEAVCRLDRDPDEVVCRFSRPEGFQTTESTDDAEARADFWSIQGDFTCRHHNEPRVQLYVPKEETFPIPLKYVDVTRSSHANLDVLQEKVLIITGMWTRLEVYQNLGFTKFTL